MKAHPSFKHAAALTLVALVGGCAASQVAAPLASRDNARASGVSWVDASAARGPLLYVSDAFSGGVNMYAYPQGKLVGSIASGLYGVGGVCSDAKGNVWVPNSGAAEIMEFAHGGTTPIRIIGATGYASGACAVDPKTGNLAVMNFPPPDGGAGSVSIFNGAKGKPHTFFDANMDVVVAVGYDDRGNLYVSGSRGGKFKWAALRRGATALKDIPLRLKTIGMGVAFDGKRIVIQSGAGATITQISGTEVVRRSALSGIGSGAAPMTIDGKTLIIAAQNAINLYAYPRGTAPKKTIGLTIEQPVGTALSY